MAAYLFSIAINSLVVLIFCFPIVIIFNLMWIFTRFFMYKFLRVDWYTHEERIELGRLPREYSNIDDMVTIKLEESMHQNFEYRKTILAKYEELDKKKQDLLDTAEHYRRLRGD
jgi:hypothetical protein